MAVAFLFVFGAACAEEHQTREANQSEIRVREVPGDELAITRVEQDGAISGQVSIHLGDVFLAIGLAVFLEEQTRRHPPLFSRQAASVSGSAVQR